MVNGKDMLDYEGHNNAGLTIFKFPSPPKNLSIGGRGALWHIWFGCQRTLSCHRLFPIASVSGCLVDRTLFMQALETSTVTLLMYQVLCEWCIL